MGRVISTFVSTLTFPLVVQNDYIISIAHCFVSVTFSVTYALVFLNSVPKSHILPSGSSSSVMVKHQNISDAQRYNYCSVVENTMRTEM